MKSCSISTLEPLERLPRGSTADVWLARRRGAQVVVKVYDRVQQSEGIARQECRAERLDHPNIARVLGGGRTMVDWGPPPAEPPPALRQFYTVQEHAPGGSPGCLYVWATMRALLRGVLLGLEHAHGQGLLHRDIKPSNVIVSTGAARGDVSVKLVDWAMCWDMVPGARNPFSAHTIGTPGYMPLEQVLGQRHLFGPWSDLYAVGCLAHRMAVGYAPLRGSSAMVVLDMAKRMALEGRPVPNDVNHREWGTPFVEWVGWLLSIPITSRPQTAREALDALEAITGPAEDGL